MGKLVLGQVDRAHLFADDLVLDFLHYTFSPFQSPGIGRYGPRVAIVAAATVMSITEAGATTLSWAIRAVPPATHGRTS
jgi:hypothetical protein